MAEFVKDGFGDDFVKVATITNESERIVRVVSKGHFSFTIETLYCEIGKYQWQHSSVYLGREEIAEIAAAVAKLPNPDDESQEGRDGDKAR
jgi:hypothetical protein